MTLTGTVERRDIEGGVFVFKADDGTVYALAGGDRGLRKDGARLELDGKVDADAVGIAMVGPVFRVTRYRAL